MWARRAAPGTRAPRGFAPGYDPAALQAAPASIHSGPRARLGGVCNTPLPWYVHSGPFGHPAKFAGVRRRPPLHRYVHSGPFGYQAKFAGVRRRPPLPWYVHSGIRPASLPRQGPSADARAFLRSDRNKCTSSSCFCLRILVRLRGQRSIRKTCVSIRNITYFISPVRMAGMFILQAPYLLPISSVCFPRCSRNPRAVNNPSRRN